MRTLIGVLVGAIGLWFVIAGVLSLGSDAVPALGTTLLDDESRRAYHTVGGLAMFVLGRIPRVGDVFGREGIGFEIVDMDGNRVDRVLVTPAPAE